MLDSDDLTGKNGTVESLESLLLAFPKFLSN